MSPALADALLPLAVPVLRGTGWLLDALATYVLHSTLIIGGLWLLSRTSLGTRLGVDRSVGAWRVALLAGVVTATLQTMGVWSPTAGTLLVPTGHGAPGFHAVVLATRSAPAGGAPVIVTRVLLSPRWPLAVAGLWLTGAAACLTMLVIARRRFLRALSDRYDGASTIAGLALRELRRRAAVDRPVALSIVRNAASPVALGGREICLPQRALTEFDLAHLETILAHELAHVERGDAAWLMMARLVECVFFFQPLNRLARRRMLEAAELRADARAVSLTARPVTLARCLARVAEWASVDRALLVPAMAERRGSSLVQRVRCLTSPAAAAGVSGTSALAAMLALVVVVGGAAPRASVGVSREARGGAVRRTIVLRDDVDFRRMDAGLPGADSVVMFRVSRPAGQGGAAAGGLVRMGARSVRQ